MLYIARCIVTALSLLITLPVTIMNQQTNSDDSSSSAVPATPPLTSPISTLSTTPENFLDTAIIPETPPRQCPTQISPLTHSDRFLCFLGKRTPTNTIRATNSSLRVFCRFVVSGTTAPPDIPASGFENGGGMESVELLGIASRRGFRESGDALPSGYQEWTCPQLTRGRFFLIEFVVNYKSKSGKEVMPSTMKGYIMGIQRGFSTTWGYNLRILEGPIFICRENGLLAVIDTKFSVQQAKGDILRSHNTLSKEDIVKLFSSRWLSRDTPFGFQAKLVFGISLVTAMRPSSLVALTSSSSKDKN